MTALDLAQLPLWLGSLFWAVGRVSGLCLVAPVFSATVVPARIRVGVVVVLSLVLAPLAPATIDPLSGDGVATMAGQVLIGAAVGFVLKLVFEAVSFGGELVGQSMSLGFAEVVSPQAGGSSNPACGRCSRLFLHSGWGVFRARAFVCLRQPSYFLFAWPKRK